jgi:hypothetical protein
MSGLTSNYDEPTELTQYIWRSYRDLMTPDELLADNAFSVEHKSQHSQAVSEMLSEQRNRYSNNSYVTAALSLGYSGFQDQVRDKFLREKPLGFVINRCPMCQKVVATALAKQCLWCDANWHG